MNDQIKHYTDKLAYEIDSWDLKVALENSEPVIVIGTRSPQAMRRSTFRVPYPCPIA